MWIGVSVLLAIGGLFIINRKFYAKISVPISISVLVIGASLNVLLTADNGEMKIYNVGNGVFATVNCPDSCSVIHAEVTEQAQTMLHPISAKDTQILNI